ncbi:MAG: metallophosphoesterase family protein [Verrucomicrobiota bacterium]|nr:metallophosphoesterase family protein [Verrucomicrobiota bacterium]
MKFAIFGDVHSNLEALNAVLEDARSHDCTHFVCIGDIVGYNANPSECLDVIQKLDCPVVKGNHDEEASLDTELVGLNPLAKKSMQWTRDNLDLNQKKYLKELKLARHVGDFTIVHATLDSPASWGYVTSKFDALESLGYQYTPVCFFGHTHVPAFYFKDLRMEEHQGKSIKIETGKKYQINVGSVGQPRDGDFRSSYCIYDVDERLIINRRVGYDIKTAQEKILKAGLPEQLAHRLAEGK